MTSELAVINALRAMSGPLKPNLVTEAADTIERLRTERDEARRMWCELQSNIWDEPATAPPEYFATEKDWDCYKRGAK